MRTVLYDVLKDFEKEYFFDILPAATRGARRKKRHGSVFQEGLKRVCLRTESRLWWQLCYTHHNGIHHGFVSDYDEWQHSSYHEYFVRNWTQLPDHLQWLGENGEGARQHFFQEHERFKASWAQEHLDQDSDIEPLV